VDRPGRMADHEPAKVKNALVDRGPAQVVDAAVAPDAETPATGAGRPVRRRRDVALRIVCHLAAELPIAVLGIVELARGWRPIFDNADLAFRSWRVFGARSPLLGHQMAVTVDGHAVFGPGPLQSWILAVPVRIDPTQGALWGGVVAVVVAVALAVEASWSFGGWAAGAVTSASVLVFALVRPELVLDVVWNVWFALLVLVCAFCSALAAASGRLRWWPVTVAAASVVVQCQAAYGPPAVALCLVAVAMGLAVRRRRGERLGGAWWIGGLIVGAVAWAAPVIQEATTAPGNLTLLVRAAGGSGETGGSAGTIGWRAALRALGGATRLPPDWVHALPTGEALARFFGIVGIVSGPAWWGLVVLGLVAAIAGLGWRTGRTRLAVLAALTLALALGALATVATIPESQFVVLGYLGALLVPVGITVWITIVWAAGTAVAAGVKGRGRWRRDVGDGPGTERTVRGPDRREHAVARWASTVRWVPVVRWASAAALVGLSTWVLVTGLGEMDGAAPNLVGWPVVRLTDEASAAARHVAPEGAFGLSLRGLPQAEALAVEAGVAYRLATEGLDARPTAAVGYPTFGHPPPGGPTVVVTVSGPGGSVRARRVRTGG
jgi:hypothetical protein